jgi:hypothetical protein
MKTGAKPKPSAVSSDLRAMIDVRHQAEQRGHYVALGRLLYLKTAHGNILWPVEDGECLGPDVAQVLYPERAMPDGPKGKVWTDDLILLGPWLPLPPVRTNSAFPCPKCRHVCDTCGGAKRKICEQVGCGGKGSTPGPFIPCPGPGCSAQTGKINLQGCEVCHNSGSFAPPIECTMCHGSGEMICPRCKGSGKISTGKIGGSVDYKADDCAACHGTGWKGAWKNQDVEKFVNAQLDPLKWQDGKKWPAKTMLALGPIYELGVEDLRSRDTRIFDVSADSIGDYLMLLIPAGHKRQAMPRAKAYLVGGVVRERESGMGAA